jgi:hypothetical protein
MSGGGNRARLAVLVDCHFRLNVISSPDIMIEELLRVKWTTGIRP